MNCYNIKHGNKYKSPRVPNAVQTMSVKCKSNDRLHLAEGIVILIRPRVWRTMRGWKNRTLVCEVATLPGLP